MNLILPNNFLDINDKKKEASLVVVLHLGVKLGELPADLLSDPSLHQQMVSALHLQLDLQLFQF